MIESESGRTDRAEVGHGRREPRRPAAEAQDRDVRKPRPALALVDAQALELVPDPLGEEPGPAALVVEDHHADGARLPVAAGREHDRPGRPGGLAHGGGDWRRFGGRTRAEEGEGDVQVRRPHSPDVTARRQLALLPAHEAAYRLVRQQQSDEEPKTLTALDASALTRPHAS